MDFDNKRIAGCRFLCLLVKNHPTMKDRKTLVHSTLKSAITISTADAKQALTAIITTTDVNEAARAVKTLNAYFDAVNYLIEAVEKLNESVKGISQ